MSDIVRAMIDGLEAQDEREGFDIDMSKFGWVDMAGNCFVCAASAALQQVLEVDYQKKDIASQDRFFRAEALGVEFDELIVFEIALNAFRMGFPEQLIELYDELPGVTVPMEISKAEEFALVTEDWYWQLPMVEDYYQRLLKHGL